MDQLPFSKPGRFFKGNIHAHSNHSDGRASLDEAVNAYYRNGYDFLAITDHFLSRFGYPITDTTSFRSDDFTTLIGAELHAPSLHNGEPWHILALGLPFDFPAPDDNDNGASIAEKALDAGAFVGIAHPAWYGLKLDDIRSLPQVHGIEIYNQGCAVDSDQGESWYLADLALTEGYRLTGFGSDDAHFREAHPDVFGAWTMVKAEELAPEPLLDALKAGNFYSSQGPLIHDISLNGDRSEIEIRTSPVNSMMLIGSRSRFEAKHGAGITCHRFSLESFPDGYFRVTVIDSDRRRAWSNPIWLDRDPVQSR